MVWVSKGASRRPLWPRHPTRVTAWPTLPSRAALGHDVSHSSAHVPEMKLEQKQELAVSPQREIAPKQEQSLDFGLGL